MKTPPLVSVIMSTYNADYDYLTESITSILDQTYKNLEFIIINDGSITNPKAIIDNFCDNRIIYIENKFNLGITKCLNIALTYCSGKYIARMDDDDISLPDRIQKQVMYFENH